MLITIKTTVTDKDGQVLLRTEYKRLKSQGEQPAGYRYFEPSGWTISVIPPTKDHDENQNC